MVSSDGDKRPLPPRGVGTYGKASPFYTLYYYYYCRRLRPKMRYRAARLSPGLDAAVSIVYVPEWPLHILFTVYIYYVVRGSGARYLGTIVVP